MAEEEIILTAKTRGIRTANRHLGAMRKSLDSIRGLATAVFGALIVREIGRFGASTLQAAGKTEQWAVAFETLFGSAKKSEKLLIDLTKFAAKTPFELEGLTDVSKQLASANFEANEIIPTLEVLGNIAAGTGVPVQQIARAFADVRIKGKLAGEELRQFRNAGVGLTTVLADKFGVSEKAIDSLVSAGAIGFDQVESALKGLTSEGGKFFNLMDKQSKTFLGRVSNLQDNLFQLKVAIGNAFLPIAEELLPKIAEGIEDFTQFAEKNPDKIRDWGRAAVVAFKGVAFVVNVITIAINGWIDLFKGLGNVLSSLGNVAVSVGNKFKRGFGALRGDVGGRSEQEQVDEINRLNQLIIEKRLERKRKLDEIEQEEVDKKTEATQLTAEEEEQQRFIKTEAELKDFEEKQKLRDREIKAEQFLLSRKFKITSKGFQNAKDIAGQFALLQDSESKRVARLGKAAAIFQATISTHESAVSSFAFGSKIGGPFLGAAFAAIAVAAGLAQVNSIKAQSFAVGAAEIPQDQLANIHAGEMIIPATFAESIRRGDLVLSGTEGVAGDTPSTIAEGGGTEININFEGANFFGSFDDDDTVRELADKLREQISEGIINPLPTGEL